jgi:hypothetical protein
VGVRKKEMERESVCVCMGPQKIPAGRGYEQLFTEISGEEIRRDDHRTIPSHVCDSCTPATTSQMPVLESKEGSSAATGAPRTPPLRVP